MDRKCNICLDSGLCKEEVYYSFCEQFHKKFCICRIGRNTFYQWKSSPKIQELVRKKKQSKVATSIRFSNIPKKWHSKTLSSLIGQEKIKGIAQKYFDGFVDNRKKGVGMYFWSTGSGRGKTHILVSLYKRIVYRYMIPAIFITEEQIYSRIRESFDNSYITEKKQMGKFKNIPFLFIDDLGATKITAWKNEMLTAILDSRSNNYLPTFFTSNFHPDDYRKYIESFGILRPDRIPSRIYEMCKSHIIQIQGEDWRRKTK